MVRVVIFDFDLTLFDSSSIKQYMDSRQWSLVYANISKCSFYPNALNAIKKLRADGIKIAIVSNSPKSYVAKVLAYYSVDIDYIVCYHDVRKHKPSPEGVYRVLNHFRITANETLYIGDNDIDYNTAYSANVKFYGVSWGIFSKNVLKINYNNYLHYVNI